MMINFWIEDSAGRHPLELPTGIEMSLMEVLQAAGYLIPATCGGIALCATCLVQVVTDTGMLPSPRDAEETMLETLPLSTGDFRLACQLRLNETLTGCVFRLAEGN